MAGSADLQITWHLVGSLQSNKAKKAAGHFGWIHSVDSRSLLERIDAAAAEARTTPSVLVQVDLAGEASKRGASLGAARAIVQCASRCRAVRLVGLMALPPFFDDPEGARPYFRRLRELRNELRDAGPEAATLSELSMGMSHDFEIAVQEGATMVRVGTAIFGSRHV